MLYDVLNSYKAYLKNKYSDETINIYLNRLEILLQGQNLNFQADKLDISKVMDNLSKIKYKSYFSQSKSAFLQFCKFADLTLSDEHLKQIEIIKTDTKKKYRKMTALDFKDIDKRIKSIRNKKLKLSFQTMLATGLRVAELAGIKNDDCVFSDDEVQFFFIGRGGKAETVKIIKSEYPKLFEDLKEITADTSADQKIFYSTDHLQSHAKRLDFKCHDLRRIFAKLEYKKSKSKNEVMKKLRHGNMKNTNLYLRNKIKFKGGKA